MVYVFFVGYFGKFDSVFISVLIWWAGVPTKHATYQIVLPIIYVYCFKGRFRLGVGMEIKKASNHTKKRLEAQSDR